MSSDNLIQKNLFGNEEDIEIVENKPTGNLILSDDALERNSKERPRNKKEFINEFNSLTSRFVCGFPFRPRRNLLK